MAMLKGRWSTGNFITSSSDIGPVPSNDRGEDVNNSSRDKQWRLFLCVSQGFATHVKSPRGSEHCGRAATCCNQDQCKLPCVCDRQTRLVMCLFKTHASGQPGLRQKIFSVRLRDLHGLDENFQLWRGACNIVQKHLDHVLVHYKVIQNDDTCSKPDRTKLR